MIWNAGQVYGNFMSSALNVVRETFNQQIVEFPLDFLQIEVIQPTLPQLIQDRRTGGCLLHAITHRVERITVYSRKSQQVNHHVLVRFGAVRFQLHVLAHHVPVLITYLLVVQRYHKIVVGSSLF
jgi:hypothetical protein